MTVGIRELKQKTSELVRLVRETNTDVFVTYHGTVVARLIPAERKNVAGEKKAWTEIDDLAKEIAANWPKDVSAVEAVSDVRR